MEKDKVEKMLELIEERLSKYTAEDTLERLHSYQGAGPTIDEFTEGLEDERTNGSISH